MDFSAFTRRWITRSLVCLTLPAICLLFTAAPALAGDNDSERLWPRLAISVGGFLSTSDSRLQADATSSEFGTSIDFETDLGIDSGESVLVARLDWLMGRRNELSLSYFKLSRTGRETIDEQIEFQEIIYPVGVTVDSTLDQEQTELAYTFWALRREHAGLGATLGIVNLGLDAELLATIEVDEQQVSLLGEASTDAPVPLVGLRGRGLLAEKFILTGELRFLPSISIDQYDGSAFAASAGVEWRITEHFGLGVNYDYFRLDIDIEEDKWYGSADLTTSGIRLMGRVLF